MHSEEVLTGMNSYMLQHLTFYLIVCGVCITVMITEWIGHRLLFSADPNSIVFNELPAIGSAVFVVFVAAALMTPPSSFSLLLFVLGVTKLGFPEILMQCWTAFNVSIRVTNKQTTPQSTFAFITNYLGAVGLMLHHFMMVTIFAGSMTHVLSYGDSVSYNFNMNMILFLVLFQHLLHQLLGSFGLAATLLIGTIEFFFQWYIVSALGEAPTTITAVAVFSLALSHWLMTPLFIFNGTPHSRGQHEVLAAEERNEELRAPTAKYDADARSARNVIGAARSGASLQQRRKARKSMVAAMHDNTGPSPSKTVALEDFEVGAVGLTSNTNSTAV
jgi:hypothetical protein